MTFHHNYPALPRGLGPSGMAQTAAFEVRKTVDIVTLQKNSETNTLLLNIQLAREKHVLLRNVLHQRLAKSKKF